MAPIYTFPPPDPAVTTYDKAIEGGLKVRIDTPDGYQRNKPVGVYFHGGGWAMGDLDGDDAFCRSLSLGGGVVFVSVEYRLAPQNKHPGLINDCYKDLQWTLDHAEEIGGIAGSIFTSEVSAGGQLALGLALKAIDQDLGIAQVPATIHPAAVPLELKSKYTSMEEHKHHTINTVSAMNTF